jgi:hypothetical protein
LRGLGFSEFGSHEGSEKLRWRRRKEEDKKGTRAIKDTRL